MTLVTHCKMFVSKDLPSYTFCIPHFLELLARKWYLYYFLHVHLCSYLNVRCVPCWSERGLCHAPIFLLETNGNERPKLCCQRNYVVLAASLFSEVSHCSHIWQCALKFMLWHCSNFVASSTVHDVTARSFKYFPDVTQKKMCSLNETHCCSVSSNPFLLQNDTVGQPYLVVVHEHTLCVPVQLFSLVPICAIKGISSQLWRHVLFKSL